MEHTNSGKEITQLQYIPYNKSGKKMTHPYKGFVDGKYHHWTELGMLDNSMPSPLDFKIKT